MVLRYRCANNCVTFQSNYGGIYVRLAVVSSDGVNVDLHLGRGKNIYVYDDLDFVEMREVEIAEDAKHQGGKVINACGDCDVLIAVQYGFKSKMKAEDAGIRLVMDEGPIAEVIQRYLDHVEFMRK